MRTLASVTLQRETATFTVPVSEAVIPASLKAAFSDSERSWTRVHDQRQEPEAIEAEPMQAVDLADENRPHAEQDQLSPADWALIRRIAPPAAE